MIKKILVSQPKPTSDKSPYFAIERDYDVELVFRPFIKVEGISSKDFRQQHVSLSDYTAVVFTSKYAIDNFFSLAKELRVNIPETMKYFCTTEAVAMYLQKHIVFRKRKIFYGNGTPSSVIDLIGPKHKDEKFLIATSDSSNVEAITSLFQAQGLDYTASVFVKSVPQDLRDVDIDSYDLVVFYNPSDIKSLYSNFPEFKPGNARFVTFGKQIVKAMEEAGLPVEIQAPTPEAPSVARALELYLGSHN